MGMAPNYPLTVVYSERPRTSVPQVPVPLTWRQTLADMDADMWFASVAGGVSLLFTIVMVILLFASWS